MESRPALPPGQQLASRGKWPQVGEKTPQGLPEDWTVEVAGLVARPQTFDLAGMAALPRTEQTIDIHCVTRWTKPAMRFAGVSLADLLAPCGVLPDAKFVRFVAYGTRGHDTSLPLDEALSLGVLVAWEVDGLPLAVHHGGAVRVVTPERYFYKSLKWLRRVELTARDQLGFWEREAGYHNTADPWREQRYLAPALSRLEVRAALKSRNFAGRELRSIDCRGHDLAGLDARDAILRDADFRDCPLAGAQFVGANLSNARFAGADLREASFERADVEGADFAGADLRDADFRGASLFGATFRAVDAGRPTRLDATTRFDDAALEALMPEEEAFVRGVLGGSPSKR
jgi:DMSO/TMAO reductase YedYZ molybdopterin-dependent catalytic subunit